MGPVNRNEPWVLRLVAQLRDTLKAALTPAKEYLATFSEWQEIAAINIRDYCRTMDWERFTLDKSREAIDKFEQLRTRVRREIPDQVWLGLLCVRCQALKEQLLNKLATLVQKLLASFMQYGIPKNHPTVTDPSGPFRTLVAACGPSPPPPLSFIWIQFWFWGF